MGPCRISASWRNAGERVKMSNCLPCGKREMISSSESAVSADLSAGGEGVFGAATAAEGGG